MLTDGRTNGIPISRHPCGRHDKKMKTADFVSFESVPVIKEENYLLLYESKLVPVKSNLLYRKK